MSLCVILLFFFFFNDTATTEIYTRSIVGSVRCVQETGINAEYMGSEQKVIVRLLGAIIDQLVHSRFIDLAATEKVVNVLFEQLNRPTLSSQDMTNALDQYLGWQVAVVTTSATQSQSTTTGLVLPTATPQPTLGQTASTPSAQSDLHLLKSMIQDEFNQLRDELKKKH
eukprot:TRINITY_DN36409_c0_g1_i2.p1 TRINITY_DN36409_c0_g1~~TRINITY_DN36409_c0_g1_i2.p1  ORF type:complete len:169 (+),score=42.22 TRINITY_DN36409_c0_g1_i2:88-594(+)